MVVKDVALAWSRQVRVWKVSRAQAPAAEGEGARALRAAEAARVAAASRRDAARSRAGARAWPAWGRARALPLVLAAGEVAAWQQEDPARSAAEARVPRH